MFPIITKLNRALIVLVAVAALYAPNAAQAQGISRNLSGTAWVGGEDITGRPTKLGFAFQNGGGAVMIDAVSPNPVKGNWRQDGDQATVTFGNCVYRGRIQGDRITGTAQMNGGGRPWVFVVQFAPPTPR